MSVSDEQETGTRAEHWPIESLDQYHADTTTESSSSLNLLYSSPWEYYQRRVAKTLNGDKESDSMRLGTALHYAVLEPHNWESRVIVLDDGLGSRTKAAQYARDACKPGQVVITQAQRQLVEGMLAAIEANPLATELLNAAGRREHAITYCPFGSEIRCKTCFDLLCDDGVIVDLKTSKDPTPEGFRQAVKAYGYHRACALYCEARDLYLGPCVTTPSYYYVVVGNEPPHECYVHHLGQKTLDAGRRQIITTLEKLAELRAYGIPELYHGPGYGTISEIDLSDWDLAR